MPTGQTKKPKLINAKKTIKINIKTVVRVKQIGKMQGTDKRKLKSLRVPRGGRDVERNNERRC